MKKETLFYDIFYIYYANEIRCEKCNNINHNFQKMNLLDFPIISEKGKVKSLEECFENYQKIQYIEDTCSKCKGLGTIHEIYFLELPSVIMINLKRVGEQSAYFHEIEIPFKLDMTKIIKNSVNVSISTYELRGFIKHDGDEKSGHNYSFCKNMFDDNWYKFNDSLVEDINDEPDLNKIFFLCYIKIGSDSKKIGYIEKIVNEMNKKIYK